MVGEYRFLLHRLCQRAQCELAYKLPSAANLLQRYAFLLKDARNYWKMFESEGDKKKKVCPACPICWARRIHLIIYMRDICPIAYFTIFMVLFPHFRINKPLPGILFIWNSEDFILHTSWPSALYT